MMKSQANNFSDNLKPSETACFVAFENEQLRFLFLHNNKVKQEITLHAGYKLLVKKFFKNEIPTFSETDYAINYIEDELMSDKSLLLNNKELNTKDQRITNLLLKNKITDGMIIRQQVEDLFSRYARVITGAPASILDAGIDREDFSVLLVVREIMHHLDFDVLNVIRE